METPSPEIFRQEAYEILSDIEDVILDMEESPDDPECINRLFRYIHTIKGSGGLYGFDRISEFSHHVENVLDKVRNGEIRVTSRLINLILSGRDHIQALLDASEDTDPELTVRLIADFRSLLPDALSDEKEEDELIFPDADRDGFAENGHENHFHIRFIPDAMIMRSGMDPAVLLEELREMGTCTVNTHLTDIPPLKELEPDICYLNWDISLKTVLKRESIEEVFIFIEEDSEIVIRRADSGPDSSHASDFFEEDDGKLAEDDIIPREKNSGKKKNYAGKENRGDSVRVSSEKLDALINLVGELIIIQERITEAGAVLENYEKVRILKMLSRTIGKSLSDFSNKNISGGILSRLMGEYETSDPYDMLDRLSDGLSEPVTVLKRLTGELRDCALNMRMVPIGSVFGKFRRLVRDLAAELGKEVEFITEGGDTELDKTLIERLNDPLVHLIRNSVDHGINWPEERMKIGKPWKGTVCLKAEHRDAHVVITVEDDGRGLDPQLIRFKALEKGLISEDDHLSQQDIRKLIFLPGFSTAKNLTKVSGRGVGMDVVKREIEAIGGMVAIESEKGRFSRFIISLPLTLAIINGLLINVSGTRYVLPMAHVTECAELTDDLINCSEGRDSMVLRGKLIPLLRLSDLFHPEGIRCTGAHVAIIEFEHSLIGLLADDIIGNVQTVIKSLEKSCPHAGGFSGATVLGDGSVAMVIDIPGLIQWSLREKAKT